FNTEKFITYSFLWLGILANIISHIIKIKRRPKPLKYQE
ncbi:EamA family transporter RarD, partial [Staphylococcus chromogenes]